MIIILYSFMEFFISIKELSKIKDTTSLKVKIFWRFLVT